MIDRSRMLQLLPLEPITDSSISENAVVGAQCNLSKGQVRLMNGELQRLDEFDGNASDVCARGLMCAPFVDGNGASTSACIYCQNGQFCEVGTVTPAVSRLENLCPPGFLCERPDDRRTCPEGSFCPAGTFLEGTTFCNVSGTYCPTGSVVAQTCPAGYYCPDASTKLLCPPGSFCLAGSNEPLECAIARRCVGGAKAQRANIDDLLVDAFVILLCVSVALFLKLAGRIFSRIQDQQSSSDELTNLKESLTGSLVPRSNSLVGRTRKQTLRLGDDTLELLSSASGTMKFEFVDLSLEVQTRRGPLKVLNGVSGSIKACRLVAVMGPSGCGKSSFLNALCGRANYGKVSGKLLINGVSDTVEKYRHITGFVPQNDTVHEDLTVEENIRFSAGYRLPHSMNATKRQCIVTMVLKILQIYHIRTSIVGSVSKRGISGGQRKRVNIGMELVARPSALFLDEEREQALVAKRISRSRPTSGLDSTSSEVILKALKELTTRGLTCVTVIHQPRFSIFSRFDRVLLLGPGGQTVYEGEAMRMQEYFESCGFQCPPGENVADFFVDVTSGVVKRRRRNPKSRSPRNSMGSCETAANNYFLTNEVASRPSTLFREWKRRGDAFKASESEGAPRHSSFFGHESNLSSLTTILAFNEIVALESCLEETTAGGSGTLNTAAQAQDFLGFIAFAVTDGELAESIAVELSHFLWSLDWEAGPNIDGENIVPRFSEWLGAKKEQNGETTRSVRKVKMAKVNNGSVSSSPSSYSTATSRHWSTDSERALWKTVLKALPRTTLLCFRRYVTKLYRAIPEITAQIITFTLAGCIVGGIIGSDIELTKPDIIVTQNAMVILLFSGLSVVSGLRTFGLDRLIFWREIASGLPVSAVFLARNIGDLLLITILPGFFVVPVWDLTLPLLTRPAYYAIISAVAWHQFGIAYFLSAALPPAAVQIVAVTITLVLGVFFGGLVPLMIEVEQSGGGLLFVSELSYHRWALEFVLCTTLSALPASFKGSDILDQTGFGIRGLKNSTQNEVIRNPECHQDGDFYLAPLLNIVFLGAMWRVLAWLALLLMNRDKQNKGPVMPGVVSLVATVRRHIIPNRSKGTTERLRFKGTRQDHQTTSSKSPAELANEFRADGGMGPTSMIPMHPVRARATPAKKKRKGKPKENGDLELTVRNETLEAVPKIAPFWKPPPPPISAKVVSN